MIAALVALGAALQVGCGTHEIPMARRPANYVYVGADRSRLSDTAFLRHPDVDGAQVRYLWRDLEPERGQYRFDGLREDVARLRPHGKRLFVQIQDVTFTDRVPVPEYLLADTAFHGGIARKHELDATGVARFDGWIARRWDSAVRRRHALLLEALAREFDGAIEGIVIPETAVSFDDPARRPPDYSDEAYAEGINAMVSAARRAFTRSCVVVYANFMPGDTVPLGRGSFLRRVHEHAARVGAGVGGPDILPFRPFQQANSLGLIAARPSGVIAAMAVQDGNLADRDRRTGERMTVAALHAFARDRLRLEYIFWGTEEPYFSSEVLPFLRQLERAPGASPPERAADAPAVRRAH